MYRLRAGDELREYRKRQNILQAQRELGLDLPTLSTEVVRLVALADDSRRRLDDLVA
jgi:hypothetical protein